jgi:EAL domain-containing protein (putative c-di-GMP-specific phosphodiesterase class I)
VEEINTCLLDRYEPRIKHLDAINPDLERTCGRDRSPSAVTQSSQDAHVLTAGGPRHRVLASLPEREVRDAFIREEFEIYYQPLVRVPDGRPRGAEALLRWRHPQRGLLAAIEFIAALEATGMMVPIGLRLVQRTIAQLAMWDVDGLSPHLDMLSINLSAPQLADPDTNAMIQESLRLHGIAPDRLCVDVTEPADTPTTRRALDAFRRVGLHVALDDIGSAHSTPTILQALPATIVKIAAPCVERLDRADDDLMAALRTVVETSHSLGLRVVAEGVSRPNLKALVWMLGCDLAQGTYLAQPMPQEAFSSWWRKAASRPDPRAG